MKRESALPLATGYCVYAVTGDEGTAREDYGFGCSNGVQGATDTPPPF